MSGAVADLSVYGIMQKSLSVIGIQVGSKASYQDMNKAIEVNKIKPVIDKVFPLSELSEALVYFDEGKHFGKVVITF